MKLYTPKPIELVRLQITRRGEQTKYLTFCDTTLIEAKEVVKNLITNNLNADPFESKFKTSLNFREAIGSKNGKAETISFHGLSIDETEKIIQNYFKNEI